VRKRFRSIRYAFEHYHLPEVVDIRQKDILVPVVPAQPVFHQIRVRLRPIPLAGLGQRALEERQPFPFLRRTDAAVGVGAGQDVRRGHRHRVARPVGRERPIEDSRIPKLPGPAFMAGRAGHPPHIAGNQLPQHDVLSIESCMQVYARPGPLQALKQLDERKVGPDESTEIANNTREALSLGFEQLLQDICSSKVGAISSVDASRQARNEREWHTLLEVCAVVGVLLIDQRAVYDPSTSNDRLLLGLKGEFSEIELRVLNERSQAAIREKAKRGELHLMISAGYLETPDGALIIDPDQRIEHAISFVFGKFRELASIRQTHSWFIVNQIEIPVASSLRSLSGKAGIRLRGPRESLGRR